MLNKIEHTAIIVHNIQDGINFYTNVLGFRLRMEATLSERRKIAFLHLPHDTNYEIELIEELIDIPQNLQAGPINHIAFIVSNIEEVIMTLKSKGVQFETEQPSLTVTGSKTIYFKGVDQEILQLIEK